MHKPDTPLHEDASLDHDWWKERGFTLAASNGVMVKVYANYLRDRSRRYRGYVICLEYKEYDDPQRTIAVTSVAEASDALRQIAEDWFIPQPDSEAFNKGYNSAVASGWWKGCPYCNDTQDFANWIAGWNQAHAKGHCPDRSSV